MTLLRLVGRVLNVVSLLVLSLAVVVNVPNQVISLTKSASAIWVTLLLGIIAAIFGIWGNLLLRRVRKTIDLEPTDARGHLDYDEEFNLSFFKEDLEALDRSITDTELVALNQSCLGSWEQNLRSTETVSPSDTRIGREIVRLTAAPTARIDTDRWFIPVIRHRKGRLIDEMSVTINGISVQTVPYRVNTSLSLLLVQSLFVDAMNQPFSSLSRTQLRYLRNAMQIVAHPHQQSHTPLFDTMRDDILAVWNIAADAPQDKYSGPQRRLMRVLNYLSDFYVVFVQVPASIAQNASVEVCVRYTEGRRLLARGLSNRTRRWLGLPIYRYRIPINEALDAVSYHFRVHGDEDTYLYTLNPRSRYFGELRDRIDSTFDLRVAPTHGTPAAHFYSRRLSELFAQDDDIDTPHPNDADSAEYRLRGLHLDIEFKPIPPGLSAPIVILSLYLSIIVTALAVSQERIFSSQAAGSSNAVLSLVIALPALMSGWVASRFDREGLRKATPNMIFELLSLLTISLLAVGVTAFKVSGSYDADMPSDYGFLALRHPTWAVVWVLVVAHTFVCIASLLARLVRYERALRRAEADRVKQLSPPVLTRPASKGRI